MGDRHNSLCFEQKHRLLGVAVDTAKPEEWKLTANIETSTHPPEGVRGMKLIRAFFCALNCVLICNFSLLYFGSSYFLNNISFPRIDPRLLPMPFRFFILGHAILLVPQSTKFVPIAPSKKY